jgi:hypothetical protein
MRKDPFNQMRGTIFFIAAMIVLVHNYSLAAEKPVDPNYLSVRISLIPVYAWGNSSPKYYINPEYFPMSRINPAAKEYLYFCLDLEKAQTISYGPNIHMYGGAIWLLGFIGDDKDITYIDTLIQRYLHLSQDVRKRFNTTDQQFVSATGCFAGMMLKRNIEGSKSFFSKYANISVWQPLEGIAPKYSTETARYYYSEFIMMAYEFSKSDIVLPYLLQKSTDSKPFNHENYTNALVNKMKIDYYTKYMKPCTVPEDKLNLYYAKFIELWGKRIEAIIKKEELKDPEKVSVGKEKPDSIAFPRITMPEMNDDESIRQATAESLKAYRQYTQWLLDGNFDVLSQYLLDNGKPIPQEKLKKTRDKLIRSLQKEKDLLEEAKKAGMEEFRDVRVDVISIDNQETPREILKKARFENFSQVVEVKQVEGAPDVEIPESTVTFLIQSTADIRKKHIPQVSDNRTIGESGELKVFMKRINGKWYWNPFGW